MRRLLSPVGFVLVGLCFVLPFVAMRAGDNQTWFAAVTWHGLDMTVGGDGRIHLAEALTDSRTGKLRMQDVSEDLGPMLLKAAKNTLFLPGQPAVIAAALLVLLGVLSAVPAAARTRRLLATVAGLGGAVALTLGEWLVVRRLAHRYPDMGAAWTYGFWLALGLLVALGAANAVLLYRAQSVRYAATGP